MNTTFLPLTKTLCEMKHAVAKELIDKGIGRTEVYDTIGGQRIH